MLLLLGASGAFAKSKIVAAYSRPSIGFSKSEAMDETKSRCAGDKTVLEFATRRPKLLRHDVDQGTTALILRAVPGDGELLRAELSEVWECLGYNPRTGRYLVGSKNEHGVKITLRALLYLDERKKQFLDSVFDDRAFEAVASLVSPGNRFLALIGAPTIKSSKVGLYSLDTDRDVLSRVGEAPAPPPLSAEQLADRERVGMEGPWDAPERHYTELEPGIWSFVDDNTLQVSYGKDSLKARAKRRRAKKWNLKSLSTR
jgi:hypothetical protein